MLGKLHLPRRRKVSNLTTNVFEMFNTMTLLADGKTSSTSSFAAHKFLINLLTSRRCNSSLLSASVAVVLVTFSLAVKKVTLAFFNSCLHKTALIHSHPPPAT